MCRCLHFLSLVASSASSLNHRPALADSCSVLQLGCVSAERELWAGPPGAGIDPGPLACGARRLSLHFYKADFRAVDRFFLYQIFT